jgi:hypothetical protein
VRVLVRTVAVAAVVTWALSSHSASPFAARPTASAQGNGSGGNDNCVVPSNGNGNCSKTFGVAVGKVGAIYPGQTKQLPVTWSNPNSFDIDVATYTAGVSVPSTVASRCATSNLTVPAGTRTPSPAISVVRNGSTSTSIPVTMPKAAVDGCQGVAFTVTVNATAVKK